MPNETPLQGKNGKVIIGTATVANLKDWELNLDSQEISSTYFGSDAFETKAPGTKSWSFTTTGDYIVDTDTDGQKAMQDAYLAGTYLTVKLYTDATHYYTGKSFVKSMKVKNDAAGLVTVDFTFTGTEALTTDEDEA